MFADNSGNAGYRLLTAVVLSTLLIVLDQRTDWGGVVRTPLQYLTDPLHYLADLPASLFNSLRGVGRSRSELADDNDRLDSQLLVLQQRVQRLAVLEAENTRLRELLNSSARFQGDVSVAEIIGVEVDPNRHELVINKGRGDGAYPGQAVLDADGLIGQLVQVGPLASRLLLITDATHALSVRVNRNGVRSVLAGTGHPEIMRLLYVPTSADIQVGDLLVSSGLGQRFPADYPVAEVSRVEELPGQPFMHVEARPRARIDRISHVLLLDGASQPAVLPQESADEQ